MQIRREFLWLGFLCRVVDFVASSRFKSICLSATTFPIQCYACRFSRGNFGCGCVCVSVTDACVFPAKGAAATTCCGSARLRVKISSQYWCRQIRRAGTCVRFSRQLLERINGVDACTVVASDAIPAFAVPIPTLANVTWANPFSQRQPLRSHQCRRRVSAAYWCIPKMKKNNSGRDAE